VTLTRLLLPSLSWYLGSDVVEYFSAIKADGCKFKGSVHQTGKLQLLWILLLSNVFNSGQVAKLLSTIQCSIVVVN
jgi:hypothetical protein